MTDRQIDRPTEHTTRVAGIKLCDLSLTRAIPDRFRDELSCYVLFTITYFNTYHSQPSAVEMNRPIIIIL